MRKREKLLEEILARNTFANFLFRNRYVRRLGRKISLERKKFRETINIGFSFG